jgi:hypothetical protein
MLIKIQNCLSTSIRDGGFILHTSNVSSLLLQFHIGTSSLAANEQNCFDRNYPESVAVLPG